MPGSNSSKSSSSKSSSSSGSRKKNATKTAVESVEPEVYAEGEDLGVPISRQQKHSSQSPEREKIEEKLVTATEQIRPSASRSSVGRKSVQDEAKSQQSLQKSQKSLPKSLPKSIHSKSIAKSNQSRQSHVSSKSRQSIGSKKNSIKSRHSHRSQKSLSEKSEERPDHRMSRSRSPRRSPHSERRDGDEGRQEELAPKIAPLEKRIKELGQRRESMKNMNQTTRRNKNFLGSMLGHLGIAKKTLETREDQETREKREEVEQRVVGRLQEEKREMIEKRKREATERREIEREIYHLMNRIESHFERVGRYIPTVIKPIVYFKPKKLNEKCQSTLDGIQKELKENLVAIKHEVWGEHGHARPYEPLDKMRSHIDQMKEELHDEDMFMKMENEGRIYRRDRDDKKGEGKGRRFGPYDDNKGKWGGREWNKFNRNGDDDKNKTWNKNWNWTGKWKDEKNDTWNDKEKEKNDNDIWKKDWNNKDDWKNEKNWTKNDDGKWIWKDGDDKNKDKEKSVVDLTDLMDKSLPRD